MTSENTAPERVAWFALLRCREGHISYDEGDGRKERCRAHVGAGNRCGAEREVIRVVEIDPLLRWLDEQYKAAVAEGEDEEATAYARVKAHIEAA